MQDKFETCAIARCFRQFTREEARDFRHTLSLCASPIVVRTVINIFTDAPISDDASAFHLSKMTGDPRLAHTQNFLQLCDRKLFLFEQKQQAQSSRVCQQPQQING